MRIFTLLLFLSSLLFSDLVTLDQFSSLSSVRSGKNIFILSDVNQTISVSYSVNKLPLSTLIKTYKNMGYSVYKDRHNILVYRPSPRLHSFSVKLPLSVVKSCFSSLFPGLSYYFFNGRLFFRSDLDTYNRIKSFFSSLSSAPSYKYTLSVLSVDDKIFTDRTFSTSLSLRYPKLQISTLFDIDTISNIDFFFLLKLLKGSTYSSSLYSVSLNLTPYHPLSVSFADKIPILQEVTSISSSQTTQTTTYNYLDVGFHTVISNIYTTYDNFSFDINTSITSALDSSQNPVISVRSVSSSVSSAPLSFIPLLVFSLDSKIDSKTFLPFGLPFSKNKNNSKKHFIIYLQRN